MNATTTLTTATPTTSSTTSAPGPTSRPADLVLARASRVIGRATERQLWLMFSREVEGTGAPLLMPVTDLPVRPSEEDGERVALVVDMVLTAQPGLAAPVLVWERPGAETLTAAEAAWVGAVRSSCRERGIEIGAQLLSSSHGVSRVD